jgi:plasmid stabilization system protein ParE
MPRIVLRPAAKRDLVLHFAWLADQAGVEVARRFLRAAESSFQDLVAMPAMGPVKMHEGKFAGVRMCRVTGNQDVLEVLPPVTGRLLPSSVSSTLRETTNAFSSETRCVLHLTW